MEILFDVRLNFTFEKSRWGALVTDNGCNAFLTYSVIGLQKTLGPLGPVVRKPINLIQD